MTGIIKMNKLYCAGNWIGHSSLSTGSEAPYAVLASSRYLPSSSCSLPNQLYAKYFLARLHRVLEAIGENVVFIQT